MLRTCRKMLKIGNIVLYSSSVLNVRLYKLEFELDRGRLRGRSV